MATTITQDNFEEQVLQSDQLVVLDFWAEWCGPCRMISPIIEELSTEYEGQALVGKVDVDSNPDLSLRYGVRNIPTILFIKNGEEVDRHLGATTKPNLKSKIDKHV